MNMLRQSFLFFCFLIISTSSNALNNSITEKNRGADKVYQSLSNAFTLLDPKEMTNVYDTNGIYVSARSELSILSGHDELYKIYNKYFNSLKQHNSSIDLRFRVTNRFIDTKTTHDIGYYLVTIIPAIETKQPPRQHAGKFMITLNQQEDGHWAILSEANSQSPNASFINAKEVDGLYYDDYHSIDYFIKDE